MIGGLIITGFPACRVVLCYDHPAIRLPPILQLLHAPGSGSAQLRSDLNDICK